MNTEPMNTELSFDRTVRRDLAHRRAVGEVFVTDSARLGEDEFALAVQIPRGHSLWGDRRADHHDPFATGEAARQAAFVVIHRYLGVPLDLPFTMRAYEFDVLRLECYHDDRKSPLDGVLRLSLSQRQFRDGELGSMRIDGELCVGGERAMRMGGDVVFLSRADYEALRTFQRARKAIVDGVLPTAVAPLAPAEVGRSDRRNVVIGRPVAVAGQRLFPLVIDRTHPSYFDHEYDHVPGPFCVEAARQAAIVVAHETGAVASPVVAMTGCRVTFTDFAEFEAELCCAADVVPGAEGGPVDVRVGLHQFGRELVTGRVELTPYP